MKKTLQFVLAIILTVTMTTPVFASVFSDLNDSKWDWATPYIDEMHDMGLINGYEDGTYRPEKSVTKQEALALFARAMGSANEDNEEVINIAVEKYGDTLKPYGIYATNEVAFLLYRGALKTNELDTYLKGSLKDEPMKRYEAAIIITKSLGAEKQANSSVLTDLEYTDALEIPISAINYVYYVTQAGLMQGMGNNSFSPNTSVLRSQIAVMLHRVVEQMELSIEPGMIINIDTKLQNITVKDMDGVQFLAGYSNNTIMNVNGEATLVSDVPTGVNAVLTYSNNSLLYVDVLSTIPDEEVIAIFQKSSSLSQDTKITVSLKSDPSTLKTYTCDKNVAVYYDGSPSTLSALKSTDLLNIQLKKGKVSAIYAQAKEEIITNATIDSIEIEPDFEVSIIHSLSQYDGKSYPIADNVVVKKNGATATFKEVYSGDKATITLEYGMVVRVVATSKTSVVEGTISAISISSTPTITVKVKGEEQVYEVPKVATITVNDKEATLYDLRVGDSVTVSLESQAVKSIKSTLAVSAGKQVTGIVEVVNTSRGFMIIKLNGTEEKETIYVDKDIYVVDLKGSKKTLNHIEAGQEVSAIGTIKNGAFEAAVVTIMSNN